MKFEFNSLGELDEFVQYLFNARAHAERIASVATSIASAPVPDAHLTTEERAAAQYANDIARAGCAAIDAGESVQTLVDTAPYGEATAPDVSIKEPRDAAGAPYDEAPVPDADHTPEQRAAAQTAHAGMPAPQTEPEPPKRKRRTKAEIEADKAAAAASAPVVETPAPSDAQAIAATSPLAGANPFDASTSNAPAATAALNEAPAGTTGTLSALGSDVRAEAQSVVDGLGADVDPQSYIALRVAEMGGTFDPREHMKKCVEFIGALGKAKYDEAFTLAGTSRAVASYTPADCAKHIAALEYLQIAG